MSDDEIRVAVTLQSRDHVDAIHGLRRAGLFRCPVLFSWLKEPVMAYEWDPRRARRMRLIRLAAAVAMSASAITVPVALLLAAAPI